MSHRTYLVLLALFALLLVEATSAWAQAPPRTGWGQPDLQGIWDFRTLTPLQRPDDSSEFLTSEEAVSLERETVARNQELLDEHLRKPIRSGVSGDKLLNVDVGVKIRYGES